MDSPSGSSEKRRRLFLALWPGEVERRHMGELAARAVGRQQRIPDTHLHLTLIFLGATTPDQLAAYEAALADMPIPAFELVLDRYGYWPRPRVLWLGSSRTPAELYEQVAELQKRLRGCGFIPERRAFQAHITLARRFTGSIPSELPKPLRWPISAMALVESLASAQGSHYRVLRRWPEG